MFSSRLMAALIIFAYGLLLDRKLSQLKTASSHFGLTRRFQFHTHCKTSLGWRSCCGNCELIDI